MKHLCSYYAGVLLIFGSTLLTNCTKEEGIIEAYSPTVHPDLQAYFDDFEEEGVKRGLEINLFEAGIGGSIEDIEGTKVLGQCSSSAQTAHSVIIDAAFWAQANKLEREFVVFHELGHCYLERSHLDSTTPGGTCTSMMNSGTTACRFNYNSNNRSSYLDELFQP